MKAIIILQDNFTIGNSNRFGIGKVLVEHNHKFHKYVRALLRDSFFYVNTFCGRNIVSHEQILD